MATNEILNNLLKQLNDARSKLSALFSLYNNMLLLAEDNKSSLYICYEKMIDIKNDLNMISGEISSAKKTERNTTLSRNLAKLKSLDKDIKCTHNDFDDNYKRFKQALTDCGSLKTEYKHELSEICKEFKANVTDDTPPVIIKGYNQQVRLNKSILKKIEDLICDYNIKKNKAENANDKFEGLYESTKTMLVSLNQIA